MRKTVLGSILMTAGIILLVYGGFQGGLLVIFPFLMTSSPIGALGILLLMLGGILLFIGMATEYAGYELAGPENDVQNGEGRRVEGRGIGLVMIGPVPLIIDTKNRRLTLISIAIFIIGIIVLAVLFLRV